MKRAAALLLAAALCLSLAACGLGGEAPARPSPGAQGPSPTPTPEPTPVSAAHPTSADVFTDWSGLTSYAPPEEKYTRLKSGPMETLAPGDYGRVLLFEGVKRFTEGEYSWQTGGLYGLVTPEGMIVLDPVCSGIHPLYRYEPDAGSILCPFLVLEKLVHLPDAPDAGEWNQGWVERCAVCAPDGSWSTDFVYESVLGSPLGALCVRAGEDNLAECLSPRGRVVFNTKDWGDRGEFAGWFASGLSALTEDSYVPVCLNSGRYIFINVRGETMPMRQALWISEAQTFSEGLAAVCVDGLWGFLDENGALAISPQFSGVSYGGFAGGYAVVYTDDSRRSAVIDRAGNVVLEDETIGREIKNGVGWYHCFSQNGPERWLDAAFRPVKLGGKTPDGCWTELGFFTEDEDGVRVLTFSGEQRFYPGAESISATDDFVFAYGGEECRVFDAENRLVCTFPRDAWPGELRDSVTGEPYIYATVRGGYDVYTARGEYLLRTYYWQAPAAGLFLCSDNLTTGYVNAAGEWVFRIRVDQGD